MDILSSYNGQEIFLLFYLITVNIISFILFALDKRRARRKDWRISENILLLVSLIGGGTGSLMAMVIFKHKLSKKRFYIGVPIFIILNRIAIIWIFNIIRW